MRQSNLLAVSVRSVNAADKKGVYFSRVTEYNPATIDVNVILAAMRMLFPSDLFKITVETYGA